MNAIRRLMIASACAPLLSAQPELPQDVLQLARLKREIGASVAALNNYTCLETIQRSQRKNAGQPFQHIDTLQIEVAVVNGQELFSLRGAAFEDRDVSEIVGSGMMSTGGFTSLIKTVLINNVSTIRWHGEEEILGRRALRWDYVVPYNLSRWEINIAGRGGRMSEHGSFWADSNTLELLRLDTNADDIPPDLQITNIHNVIDYARTRVRSRDLLLPRSVELLVTHLNGIEHQNRIEFSECREFSGSSNLTFDQR